MKFPVKSITALAVAAAAFIAVPMLSADAGELSGRKVKIGAMVPKTGKGAEWGHAAQASMEMAADEINKAGGIGGVPIDILFYDYQAKESEGLNIFNRLVERDKVLAVSGPCFSSVFEILAPLLERLKTPMISYCSSKPGLSALSDWAFRNTLTSDKQLKPVVAMWAKEYNIKKAVIIHDLEDAVSRAEGEKIMPGLLKDNGIEQLAILTYRTKDTDFSAQITKAKALGAEGIALGACYQQAAAIAKEARKQGLNAPIVGGACAGAPGFVDIAGSAAEGAYMSTAAWIDDPRKEVQDYVKKLQKKMGKAGYKPPYGGPRAYDLIYALKHCMENFGVTNNSGDLASDRDKIRQCWKGMRGFPGVSGEITMDEVGDGTGSSAILKVIGGKYVNVKK